MRIMKYLLIVMACALSMNLSSAAAEEASASRTPLQMNGSDWKELSDNGKVIFLAGFNLGCYIPWREVSKIPEIGKRLKEVEETFQWMSFGGFTGAELRDKINILYLDPANKKIAIVDAIYIAKMELSGRGRRVIDAQIEYLKMFPISSQAIEDARKKVYRSGDSLNTEDIKSGRVKNEDILTCGIFIDDSGKTHYLFSYGDYQS